MKKFLILILTAAVSMQFPQLMFAETAPLTTDQLTQSPTVAFDPNAPVSTKTTTATASTSPDLAALDQPLSLVSPTDALVQETSTTTGHVYYVSQGQSVQKAVSLLKAGDTLYINEGVYHESVSMKTSGRSDAYITIRGVGNVVFDGAPDKTLLPAFDTKGYDFLKFENLSVTHMRAAVEVSSGSNYVEIDGLKSGANRFAVRINASTNITVRNAEVSDSNNGFRAYGGSRSLLFENITVHDSRDIYDGMDPNYNNGDGFIFEADVSNVTLRNILTYNNWDGGVDCKASNVLMENVIAYGNKNNWKIWGQNVVIRDSLSFGAKRQLRTDGSYVEGNGITMEAGGSAKLINVTIADNDHREIELYDNSTLIIQDSIVSRQDTAGLLFHSASTGVFTSDNVLWFNSALSKPFSGMSSADFWANPLFADRAAHNYQLTAASPALDRSLSTQALPSTDLIGNQRVAGEKADLGAYEFTGILSANFIPDFGSPAVTTVSQTTTAQAAAPEPQQTTVFSGVHEGAVVSGMMLVQFSAEIAPQVTYVTYFLDGKKITSTSKAPFVFGSSKGYDTTKLKDGKHVLTAVYKTAQGDMTSTLNFTVKNP